MKSKVPSKIIILSILGILFALSPIFVTNLSFTTRDHNMNTKYYDEKNYDHDNLKSSDISGTIHIDNNWTAAAGAGICTGNGTYSDPYVIEDLIINGGGGSIGNCILIQNSDVYFRIENCTVYNSGGSSGNAGIQLYNVTKSQLIDNLCYSNAEGIYLIDSYNNSIIGNTVHNNYNGIYLSNSNKTLVSGNNASDHNLNLAGIMVRGNDNIISGNILNRDGINLGGNNNTISGNIMNACGLRVWNWDLADLISHNIDNTNLVNDKPLYYYSSEVNLESGDFLNAGQVILVNCNDSKISNLNISYTCRGVSLHYCHNNEISDNIANHNLLNGIRLESSDNNIISGNIANNGTGEDVYGIELLSSDNNVILDNTVNNNIIHFGYGIFLWNSDNNLISGNNANNNYASGIYISDSTDNNISGNNANDNWNGIRVRESANNTVSNNIVNNNENGIVIEESTHNEVSRNIANNNTRGIMVVIYSDNNDILENDADNNDERGIYIALSSYNTISGNTASFNDYGIYLEELCNINTITENIINYNRLTGIAIDNSNGNMIFLNCFSNNVNAVDDGSNNHWDNGVEGNFWGDYKGNDANSDGIGDTPYIITGSAGSQDRFPLMTCPIPTQDGEGFPLELIIIISVISGGAVIGLTTLLLIIRKRKRLQLNPK